MANSTRCGALRGAMTLIEFLAVVTSVILLAFLTLPLFVGSTDGDQVADSTRAVISSMANDFERFKLHCGRYPRQLDELIERPTDVEIADKWRGPYVKRRPVDAWGTSFGYVCPGRHLPQTYDLWSFGPDRTSGTSDDITNWD